jgi:hypothetical protein
MIREKSGEEGRKVLKVRWSAGLYGSHRSLDQVRKGRAEPEEERGVFEVMDEGKERTNRKTKERETSKVTILGHDILNSYTLLLDTPPIVTVLCL